MSSRNDYCAYLCLQNDGLAHHGVKGMKWGARKDQDISTHYPNNIRNKHIYKRGKSVRGVSELWEIGKAVVEAMLGGDESAF